MTAQTDHSSARKSLRLWPGIFVAALVLIARLVVPVISPDAGMKNRWNWGLVGGQIPYLSSGFQSSVGRLPNGDLVESDQLFVFRQTERNASGVLAYPLDRSRRVEFQAGVSNISFDQVVQTTTYSLINGAVYEDSSKTTPLAQTLNLGTSSAAYVFDTSVFGATSPVQGQRYRFEASPTFGSINFTGLLADYRRYFMYGSSFYDLDGHHWEVLWMDPAVIQRPEEITTQTVQ